MSARFDMAGRVALVTGGTSGIGAAIACGLADSGAEVIAAGLDPEATPSHPGLRAADLDVTSDASLAALLAGLDRLDAVVACAGVIRREAEHDPDVFATVVDVNLTGTMRTLAACRPLLVRSGGAAVATASMLSYAGGPHAPAYSASKGGVVQLVKSLAAAWARDGVRVNGIAPGWIATPLTASLRADPDRAARVLARTPMGRWGEPDDLVGPVLFLLSDAARFVTGAVLPVDGGYLAV